ncbi:hypothetical protein [Streptomyces sp. NPDC059008]
MSQTWPEYVAGVLVLATGFLAAQIGKAWRRRRRRATPEVPQPPAEANE